MKDWERRENDKARILAMIRGNLGRKAFHEEALLEEQWCGAWAGMSPSQSGQGQGQDQDSEKFQYQQSESESDETNSSMLSVLQRLKAPYINFSESTL